MSPPLRLEDAPDSGLSVESVPARSDAKTRQQRFLQGHVFAIATHWTRLTCPPFVGTRQATLPGGHRTGAPGRFVIRGTSKYRLLDEKVRVFVGPSIEEITQSEVRFDHPLVPITQRNQFLLPFFFLSAVTRKTNGNSNMNDGREQLKPYVHVSTKLSNQDRRDAQLLVPILPGTKIKQWRRNAEGALIENRDQA